MRKKIISALLALILCCSLAVSVSAGVNEYFLFDEADLLTNAEEAALERKLENVSDTYNAQIVVCTIDSIDGGNVDRFADYLYDSMGFGYGENKDGALLLVCMDIREYRILSNGYASVAIDNGDIAYISDMIVSDLSAGDYAAAFSDFADQCAYYLEGYTEGFPFDFGKNLLIALVIGIVVGLVVVLILKSQLKSVRMQNQANAYVKQGSMNLTHQRDIYLYRTVSRTRKATSNSSSGGGGRSRGGGSF